MFVVLLWWLMLPYLANYSPWIKLAFPAMAWTTLDPILVSTTGGTPGHHLRGITVQRSDAALRLGIARSLLRALIKSLTGWWAFIFVLATKRHQALHDLVSSSVVILREPQSLPASERMAERDHDSEHYEYPSVFRRIIITFTYIIVVSVGLTLLKRALLSNDCLTLGACMTLDFALFHLLDIIWFLAVGAAVVFGWRSDLPGARKRKLESQDLN
ncbi:MAG: hypothetical protein B6D72_16915 [gamma proteobacterium symbiont of Ctena orbiculata]|nr:RDD family protein [Candidatus Thiodiazotropha taylori]PUB90094.1 MAG: hypothetical protein DBP00_00725 [gamma proteobacterium symbiont of Ctena orbiculata]MBT2996637.1 RDD family protein [Candidatus Thiodiazotropha taylori]MBT3000677.1 RDD family protein [Candidatus Thiodiazotropha taylori]MBV2107006.1 RDD family protein [Candidatus Thiodiazotropha taylori]